MGLNKSKGNMYEWIDFTVNFIKGACPFSCKYCYMKRWGKQSDVHFDRKERDEFDRDMKKYGEGHIIFVGSSCDMFAWGIPEDWIKMTIGHISNYDNQYLFQTKNPQRLKDFWIPDNSLVCTTLETNRFQDEIMGNAPTPRIRADAFKTMQYPKYVTIEPIMDFDLGQFSQMLFDIRPKQINIGADSGGNNLPEPDSAKLEDLINILSEFTYVVKKKNLKRLL